MAALQLLGIAGYSASLRLALHHHKRTLHPVQLIFLGLCLETWVQGEYSLRNIVLIRIALLPHKLPLPSEGVANVAEYGLPHHKWVEKCKKLLSFAEKFYLRIFSTCFNNNLPKVRGFEKQTL
jgi:hypothetical protein